MPDPARALARAREHCFFVGPKDGGGVLCRTVAPYGIAKLHHVQRRLGLPADASFVAAPDATVTRNRTRWRQGFSYGGVYAWSGDLAVLDLKPNCCGTLVGRLRAPPDPERLAARAERLEREGLTLEGVRLDWDLRTGNHFCNVVEVTQALGTGSPPPGSHLFLLHASGKELRGPTDLGPGLYFDQSDELRRLARVHETPWGTLSVLTGEQAAEWVAFCQEVQGFAHRRREHIARELFGDYEVVSNETHQGLVRGIGHANIGCYVASRKGPTPLYPVAYRRELPAYLVRARPNYEPATLEELGWTERAARHDLTDRLTDTHLVPHGGGYDYPGLVEARVADEAPDARRYELTWEDGSRRQVLDVRDLPYEYRGLVVHRLMLELGLAEPVAELRTRASL